MKILIPLIEDNNLNSKIALHFGHAPFFGIYDLDIKKFEIVKNNLNHSDDSKSPIKQIKEMMDPDIIFSKNIGRTAINEAKENNILLKTGDYELVSEVISNLDKLNDDVKDCGH